MAAKRTSSRRPVKKKAARKKAVKARRPQRHKPESLRLRSATPGLTVNDIQVSLGFYRDVLGFTPNDEWRENGELRGVELKAGSVSLWINQDDWKQGRDRQKGVGHRIFFTTAQDIDALARRIKASGGTLLHEPETSYGFRNIGVQDPDGFRMTIQMPVKKGR